MKLVARILIILFVNKFSAYGVPILQTVDLAAENETNSSAGETHEFAAQTSVTETLPELNLPEELLEKDKNNFLKNFSQLEELPKPVRNRNLTNEDLSRIVLEQKLGLIYQQVEVEDVNDVSDKFEMEKSATARPFTASEEIDTNSLPAHEKYYKNAAIQPKPGRNHSHTFTQNNNEIVAQSAVLEGSFVVSQSLNKMLEVFPGLAETHTDEMDKFDPLDFKVHVKQQDGGEFNVKHLNHSWVENEYRIATKAPNSNDTIQSSNLAERELIEIVLKEATNLIKQPDGNNANTELAPSKSQPKSALTKKASTEEGISDSNSTLKSVSILFTNLEELPNSTVAIKQQEENAESSSEGTDITLEPQALNVNKNDLEIEGIRNMTQEETTSGDTENSFNLATFLLEADELMPTTSSSLTRPETVNEPENELPELAAKELSNLNRTQEKYLIDKKSPEKVAAKELSQTSLNKIKGLQNFTESENKLQDADFADHQSLNKEQEERYSSSLEHLAAATENSAETENGMNEAVLPEAANLNKTRNENDLNAMPAYSASEDVMLTAKPLNSVNGTQHSNVTDDELEPKALEGVTMTADQELDKVTSLSDTLTDLSSTEPAAELTTSTTINMELTTDLLNEFDDSENYRATEGNVAMCENTHLRENKQFSAELSAFSLSDKEEEEVQVELEEEEQSSTRPLIRLEEYAVKQMNFILDHLLLETQTFVAKVLQATINSVFPRDRLKYYAEGVNRVLNPATESEYSDEISETIKSDDQDEDYEQIVEKLNFFKNKPSKYLQKQIPPEWLKDFLAKRAELAIWLDKAAEQMHQAFSDYITEEADPIKYQYFNETFDDISRATEIHHKLALLADLVKIIKNKKQITFMDLYMQT